jgi:hypothetical protein
VRAPLAEIVYVRPPKILADRFGSNFMKLNKALYGLKQAPLSWHSYMEKMFDTVKILLCAAKDETSVEFMRPLLNSWAECSEVISC